jgi:TBC1 domain family member 20
MTIDIRGAFVKKDIASLRLSSIERNGYDLLRKDIWSLLLSPTTTNLLDIVPIPLPTDTIRQIDLDINRSFTQFNIPFEDLAPLKDSLRSTIHHVLERLHWCHYYQGFHDIASLILLICKEQEAKQILLVLCCVHLRDFMTRDMDPTMEYIDSIGSILRIVDEELYKVMKHTDLTMCVPWVLSWCTHSLHTKNKSLASAASARLFDYLISHNPDTICYVSVAILQLKRKELMNCGDDEGEFFQICKDVDVDVEKLIRMAARCQDQVSMDMSVMGGSSFMAPKMYQEFILEGIDVEKCRLYAEKVDASKKRKNRPLDSRVGWGEVMVMMAVVTLFYYKLV